MRSWIGMATSERFPLLPRLNSNNVLTASQLYLKLSTILISNHLNRSLQVRTNGLISLNKSLDHSTEKCVKAGSSKEKFSQNPLKRQSKRLWQPKTRISSPAPMLNLTWLNKPNCQSLKPRTTKSQQLAQPVYAIQLLFMTGKHSMSKF